jgi:hypothetical protein
MTRHTLVLGHELGPLLQWKVAVAGLVAELVVVVAMWVG